jgi:hypothetical protein
VRISGDAPLFFFFSDRLGCLGSLLVTAVATLIVLALLDFINFGGGGW